MDYRNNEKELKYYGSDYNKFIGKECPHTHTCNNIDVIQYKRSRRILRICESKHDHEHLPGTQLEILKLLARIFRYLNKIQKRYRFEIYIVTGNHPYKTVKIENMITGEGVTVNQLQLINFSGFEKTFDELIEDLINVK